MKIHEYQAKGLLRDFGIPVPNGEPAFSVDEAKKIASKLGGKVVIKAQIHAGGRGKAGGVKLVSSVDEAEKAAKQILGMNLISKQTGPEGKIVKRLLVEEASDIKNELYLGIVLDRAAMCPVIMASTEGGMEIEEVAEKTPEKILKEYVDPAVGLRPFQASKLAFGLGLAPEVIRKASDFIMKLYKLYETMDCTLAEINPLVITGGGEVIALDAKMTFDDNAMFRHKDLIKLRDLDEEDTLEVEASKYSLNYIKLDGNVGCMVNGAGLAMATMDIIKLSGGYPANFLDVGGGASAEQVENAFKILTSDKNVKAILINIFGGILRCDRVAEGMIEAAKKVEMKFPIVVRLEGTNADLGSRLLEESGLTFHVAKGFSEAAKKVVELAVAN